MAGRYREGTVCYEKDRGKYRAYVWVDGRKYTKRFSERDDALAWVQKMRLAAHDGLFVAPSALSLGEWLVKYLETYKKPTVKPTTYERYLFTSRKALPIASIPIQKLTALDVQQLYNSLTPDGAKKLHVLLHSAMEKAVALDMVRRNVVAMAKPPRVVRKEKGIFSADELKIILHTIEKNPIFRRYYNLVLLAINTGMRRGELLGLRWRDVDFKSHTVTIAQQVQQLSDGTVILDTPKTEAGRRKISIPMNVSLSLQRVKDGLREIDISQNMLVFRNGSGHPIRPEAIEKMWKQVLQESGLPYRSFHCLRHTHATLLLANGIPIIEVSRRLGHSSVKQTLDMYGHAIPNYDQEIARKIAMIYG